MIIINKKRDLFNTHGKKSANKIVELLETNNNITFLTNGEMSIFNILNKYKIKILYIFTFSIGLQEIELLSKMACPKYIIIDEGFKRRLPLYYDKLIGSNIEEIKEISNHSKVYFFETEDLKKIVIRGSANLNRNIRIENIDIDINENMYNYFKEFYEKIKIDTSLKRKEQLDNIFIGDIFDLDFDFDFDLI